MVPLLYLPHNKAGLQGGCAVCCSFLSEARHWDCAFKITCRNTLLPGKHVLPWVYRPHSEQLLAETWQLLSTHLFPDVQQASYSQSGHQILKNFKADLPFHPVSLEDMDPSLLSPAVPALCTEGNVCHKQGGCTNSVALGNSDLTSTNHTGMLLRRLLRGGPAGLCPRYTQHITAHELTPWWLFSLSCLTFSTLSLGFHPDILPESKSCLRDCTRGRWCKPPTLTSFSKNST
jgi:hypothetical protein